MIKVTRDDWESYGEDEKLYVKRASGKITDPLMIVEEIIKSMKIEVSEYEKVEITRLRVGRFRNSLIEIDETIIKALKKIRESGKKLCLISNTDVIDVMYWSESPLKEFFDEAVFSYETGYLKPQAEIYQIALKRMNIAPSRCIFIGDGGSNELKGAKALGVRTVLTSYLLSKTICMDNEIMEFVDYYVEDFCEINGILAHR